MKKNKTSMAAVLFFVAMFFVSSCSKETETPDPGNGVEKKSAAGPSVNGQGALSLDYPGTGTIPGVQHFSFHASTDKKGNVTGSFETKWGVNGRVHGTIDCLSIQPDSKTAIMTGTITHLSGDIYVGLWGMQVGYSVWFKVQDNGEGATAPKDKFSDFTSGEKGYLPPCVYDLDLPLVELLNGNIQVKP